MIRPKGEAKPLFTDLYDATDHVLIEAKGSVTREAIRMAIGQLADYRRFLHEPACAILLPSKPRAALLRLIADQKLGVIWREENSFVVG